MLLGAFGLFEGYNPLEQLVYGPSPAAARPSFGVNMAFVVGFFTIQFPFGVREGVRNVTRGAT